MSDNSMLLSTEIKATLKNKTHSYSYQEPISTSGSGANLRVTGGGSKTSNYETTVLEILVKNNGNEDRSYFFKLVRFKNSLDKQIDNTWAQHLQLKPGYSASFEIDLSPEPGLVFSSNVLNNIYIDEIEIVDKSTNRHENNDTNIKIHSLITNPGYFEEQLRKHKKAKKKLMIFMAIPLLIFATPYVIAQFSNPIGSIGNTYEQLKNKAVTSYYKMYEQADSKKQL